MKKRIVIIISIVLVIVVVAATSIALAIWTENPDLSLEFEMWSADENASLKYQLFVPVDDELNRIPGSLDIPTKTYTLDNYGDSQRIAGLAFVGFNGGIAVDVLTIPPYVSYTVTDDSLSYRITYLTESTDYLPIYRCLADTEFRDYYVMGHQLIRRVYLSFALNRIDSGFFANMPSLTLCQVVNDGVTVITTDLVVGQNVFINCPYYQFIVPDERGVIYE